MYLSCVTQTLDGSHSSPAQISGSDRATAKAKYYNLCAKADSISEIIASSGFGFGITTMAPPLGKLHLVKSRAFEFFSDMGPHHEAMGGIIVPKVKFPRSCTRCLYFARAKLSSLPFYQVVREAG